MMESVETLISDGKDNYLVVVLYFYDDIQKAVTFQIPTEYYELEIADISINKLNADLPLNIKAFFKMFDWLIEQFNIYRNAVFSFICATNSISSHHPDLSPQQYRWRLFDSLCHRNHRRMNEMDIAMRDIIVGEEEYQTFARVFYRREHEFLINVVLAHLNEKYHS